MRTWIMCIIQELPKGMVILHGTPYPLKEHDDLMVKFDWEPSALEEICRVQSPLPLQCIHIYNMIYTYIHLISKGERGLGPLWADSFLP